MCRSDGRRALPWRRRPAPIAALHGLTSTAVYPQRKSPRPQILEPRQELHEPQRSPAVQEFLRRRRKRHALFRLVFWVANIIEISSASPITASTSASASTWSTWASSAGIWALCRACSCSVSYLHPGLLRHVRDRSDSRNCSSWSCLAYLPAVSAFLQVAHSLTRDQDHDVEHRARGGIFKPLISGTCG
jgi:hypothetical protein